jgi:DNA-binding LacI/PurR family transcriptional regulator
VLAKAAELGYTGPHAVARSLRTGRAGALGVVLGETLPYAFEDPAALQFLRGLARTAVDSGVALHLVPAGGDAGDPALVRDAAVDAFVVFSLPDGHQMAEALVRRGLPTVIEGGPELPGCPLVGIDERAAAAAAAEHVLGLGHRRIGVISLPVGGRPRGDRPIEPGTVAAHRVTRGRLEGYRAAIAACESGDGAPCLAAREAALNDRARGEAAARALLAADDPPTALLCMSDELAIGALRVAGDVSVVGWDDTGEDARLTTIRQSLTEHGRVCAELAAGRPEPGLYLQPWELIVRESTRPPG